MSLTGELENGESWRKEDFSKAYVSALAAAAGAGCEWVTRDYFKTDGYFKKEFPGAAIPVAQLDFQLKSTTAECRDETQIRYELERAAHNFLANVATLAPRVLIVVLLPADVGEWVATSEEALALRRCGYWLSLRGAQATQNAYSITVGIPRANALTAPALDSILARIASGQQP